MAKFLNVSQVFAVTRWSSPNLLVVVNYHRIAATHNARPLFDPTLFGPDEETFRREVRKLKSCADPVSEADLLAAIDKGAPLPKRGFMITFDDGYRDNFELAAPVLKELGVPAAFFIPTQIVDERHLGWWDYISWFINNTTKTSIVVEGERISLTRPAWEIADILNNKMKLGAAAKTKTLIAELSRMCDVPMPPSELCDRELMSWDQIRELRAGGHTIGSHAHTHRVLACLDLESQRKELSQSKAILEEQLGAPVRSIAYPAGGYEHFNTQTMEIARECGYELGYSFMTGVNETRALDRFNIRRIDRQADPALYEGVFAMPWLFGRRTCNMARPEDYAHG